MSNEQTDLLLLLSHVPLIQNILQKPQLFAEIKMTDCSLCLKLFFSPDSKHGSVCRKA